MNKPALPYAPRERALQLAIVFLCFVLVYFTWFPGVFTMDELDIFNQSRGGPKHDGHSPLLVRFWGLTGRAVQGPALPYFIGLAAVMYFGYSLLRRLSRSRADTVLTLCVLVLLPPVFVALGLVTKDLFFVAAMLAVCVALANHVEWRTLKTLLITGLAMQLAVMIRIDAVFALFPLLIYVCWLQLAAMRGDSAGIKFAAIVLGALLVLCLLGFNRLTNRYVFRTTSLHGEQVTMLFDLSAMSVGSGTMLLPPSRLHGGFPLPVMRARFNPSIADALIWGPDENHLIYATEANHAELHEAWWKALRAHPLTYLKFRAEYMAQFIGLRNNTPRMRGQFYGDGTMIKEGPEVWAQAQSPLQQLYLKISESKLGKYIFMPWLWFVAGLLALAGFAIGKLRTNGTYVGWILPQLMVISALSYTFLMGTVSAASLSRYHSWPRVAIGIVVLVALRELVPLLSGRFARARKTAAIEA